MLKRVRRVNTNRAAKKIFKVDPTRTVVVRRKFEREMARRFVEIRKAIRIGIGENDALGLLTNPPPMVQQVSAPGAGQFDFRRSSDKVSAFMEWLERAEQNSVLQVIRGTTRGAVGSKSWADVYIQTAYQRGLAMAASRVRKAGVSLPPDFVDAAFLRPVHADRAGLIFTRVFEELKGITAAMGSQISQVLAEGIAEGIHPKTLAKRLVDRVDKIGITRARMLARTEVIASHAEASLNLYREAGLEGVTADVEFATAQDSKVCSKCQALEGQEFTLKQAAGVIPVHPNCRCAWLPVIK